MSNALQKTPECPRPDAERTQDESQGENKSEKANAHALAAALIQGRWPASGSELLRLFL
ncbi:MAG: hypothetical protein WEG36_03645 [Gemmatimonadota bacterium]